MEDKAGSSDENKIENLELIHWVNEEESISGQARKYGEPITEQYSTFDEVRSAILAKGPISITTNWANLHVFVLDGEFDNELMVLRQSGLNIRRFLVRECFFVDSFGDFQGCIDHHLSFNAVDCELEISHLESIAEKLDLDAEEIDRKRDYSRLKIDVTAGIQLLKIITDTFGPYGDDQDADWAFSIGFSVGRIFSSIQKTTNFEPMAHKGFAHDKNYRAKGKKSGSKKRKYERLTIFMDEVEKVFLIIQQCKPMRKWCTVGKFVHDAGPEMGSN